MTISFRNLQPTLLVNVPSQKISTTLEANKQRVQSAGLALLKPVLPKWMDSNQRTEAALSSTSFLGLWAAPDTAKAIPKAVLKALLSTGCFPLSLFSLFATFPPLRESGQEMSPSPKPRQDVAHKSRMERIEQVFIKSNSIRHQKY